MTPAKDTPALFLVHCVDTEGPLYESLGATFERLRNSLGIQLTPSRETLAQDPVRRA